TSRSVAKFVFLMSCIYTMCAVCQDKPVSANRLSHPWTAAPRQRSDATRSKRKNTNRLHRFAGTKELRRRARLAYAKGHELERVHPQIRHLETIGRPFLAKRAPRGGDRVDRAVDSRDPRRRTRSPQRPRHADVSTK